MAIVTTVREMLEALSHIDPDTPIRVHVDDGCGCCSSGGNWEEVAVDVTDGMVQLA